MTGQRHGVAAMSGFPARMIQSQARTQKATGSRPPSGGDLLEKAESFKPDTNRLTSTVSWKALAWSKAAWPMEPSITKMTCCGFTAARRNGHGMFWVGRCNRRNARNEQLGNHHAILPAWCRLQLMSKQSKGSPPAPVDQPPLASSSERGGDTQQPTCRHLPHLLK